MNLQMGKALRGSGVTVSPPLEKVEEQMEPWGSVGDPEAECECSNRIPMLQMDPVSPEGVH